MFCLKTSTVENNDVLRRRGGKFLSQVASNLWASSGGILNNTF